MTASPDAAPDRHPWTEVILPRLVSLGTIAAFGVLGVVDHDPAADRPLLGALVLSFALVFILRRRLGSGLGLGRLTVPVYLAFQSGLIVAMAAVDGDFSIFLNLFFILSA